MKRIDSFETELDALLEKYSDVSCEDLADSLDYYARTYQAKANRDDR